MCRAIIKVLLPKYIEVLIKTGLTSVISGFDFLIVVERSHIPIEAPQHKLANY